MVPDYPPTIQAAIDSAATGDTVLVREGTYVENLHIMGKTLTLIALGAPEATIIDGNQAGSVIEVTSDAHIEGFTIRNGRNADGGGVLSRGSPGAPNTVHLVGNIIHGNRAWYGLDSGNGGGVALYICEGCVVEGNSIRNNYAGYLGGGLYCRSLGFQIRNNTFIENEGGFTGGGIGLESGDGVIEENLILANEGGIKGGGIGELSDGYLSVVIRRNTIVQNRSGGGFFVAGAGLHIWRETASISENIVAFNYSGRDTEVGVYCAGSAVSLQCNDVWGNEVDFHLEQTDTTGAGNTSVDPLFCDPDNGDYSLASDSPCREDGPSGCGLIGAFGVGCQETPVVPVTWGRIKTIYDPRS